MKFTYNDGGRSSAGYKGVAGDCVTRAIAIATNMNYQQVYDDLNKLCKNIKLKSNSRSGLPRKVYDHYLKLLGWRFVATMQIGSGCKIHLKADELPTGRIICRLSRHLVAVINGVIHDTHDCSRKGTRCVYGYYINQ